MQAGVEENYEVPDGKIRIKKKGEKKDDGNFGNL